MTRPTPEFEYAGKVKSNFAAEAVPLLMTVGCDPIGPIVTVTSLIVAANPSSPFNLLAVFVHAPPDLVQRYPSVLFR